MEGKTNNNIWNINIFGLRNGFAFLYFCRQPIILDESFPESLC